ncbi:hypothetical protein F3Y22_tig00110328pilonHSYRG01277 [Hibiscus syriacus]|uniref:Uncharacterized protein n=1 Tax=Hibiscus syriacus TaxID=106335 RepID=A0A6A3B383_HIBSY|nr:hypothetical protein F3Y22_tig00110328pilonHSYRG01277 [Hibiscus syriacus]
MVVDRNGFLNWVWNFNHDTKYKGATAKPVSCIKEQGALQRWLFNQPCKGFLLVLVLRPMKRARLLCRNWRHFGLDRAFVDSKTPIKVGRSSVFVSRNFCHGS